PSTSRDSFLTIVPAPWCGYTTLSPTLYKPTLPFFLAFPPKEPARVSAGPGLTTLAKTRWKHEDFRPFRRVKAANSGRRGCAPAGAAARPGSPGRAPNRPLPRPPGRAGRPG